jgi:hypothetical protein
MSYVIWDLCYTEANKYSQITIAAVLKSRNQRKRLTNAIQLSWFISLQRTIKANVILKQINILKSLLLLYKSRVTKETNNKCNSILVIHIFIKDDKDEINWIIVIEPIDSIVVYTLERCRLIIVLTKGRLFYNTRLYTTLYITDHPCTDSWWQHKIFNVHQLSLLSIWRKT